jgi:hypothetical protein
MQRNVNDLYTGHKKKPRICFVSHFAYWAIAESGSGHIMDVEK